MKYFASRISENLHETPEGYLLAPGVSIGRVGAMEYAKGETPIAPGKNGTVNISRSAEELFRPATIASFEGKPFTIKHPEEFVNKDNWKVLAKGIIQNVRKGKGEQADDLVADILITDSMAISLVKNGLRGLSCGYEAEYVETGEGEGIQKNIIGNHLALVEEGRAGDSYAINDEKGVFRMKKSLAEKLKTLFSKTLDEAVAKDEESDKGEKKDESKDAKGYDELVSMCKDLMDKVSSMGQPNKDEDKDAEKKDDAKDDESEGEQSMEDRLKALETAVSKLLEAKAGDEDDEEESEDDGEDDVVIDADEEKEGEAKDEEQEEMTGDEKARVEILAPGLKVVKDAKAEALKAAYKTADGKKAIDALTGGKPTFDSAAKVNSLFLSASELLKVTRTQNLSRTKRTEDFRSVIFQDDSVMTAEKMNAKNEQHYKRN